MPTIDTINDDKKPVTHYCATTARTYCYMWFTDYDDASVEHLKLQRKYTVNLMQEMIVAQKAAGREYPENARWFSQFVKDLQKYERAYTIVLQYIEGTNPRNDYQIKHWPVDLVEYLDHARALYDLARAGTFIDNGFQPLP